MIPDVGEKITELVDLVKPAEGSRRTVHDYVPEDPIPPCWIVQGSQDVVQLDPDSRFDQEYLVSLDVVMLVELDDEHDNESATRELWTSLSDLAAALESTEGSWWLENVGQPGTLQTLHWKHHGVLATVRTRT